MTLYLECSGSGTEDKESQPMTTRPKGIESAAIGRCGDVDIADNGPYVAERLWTTTVVRSPLTGKRAWFPLEAGCFSHAADS